MNCSRILSRVGLVLMLLCAACALGAQSLGNLRAGKKAVKPQMQLDSLSILPGTLELRIPGTADPIPESDYRMDWYGASLDWQQLPASDSVFVSYRVFPRNYGQVYFHKDRNARLEQEEGILLNPFSYSTRTQASSIVDFGELDYSGNFERGLSFGNNQDVILNSSFNLQLAGKITRDVEILAAITDNNIPLQPDGNTQQIQDFDRVYIQIKKDPHQLTVGDIDMRHPDNTYFLRYVKNAQGGKYKGEFKLGNAGSLTTDNSIAVATGQFARNQLQPEEGNQGPYKLQGANGEAFIIVIAGTERVFLNGEQLVRGADNDYTIDYNLGEITFTPKRLITRDLRISVEFQYSVRSYFRSIIHTNAEYHYDKLNVRFNFFNEQDNKNQPVQEELDAAQRNFLENIGDSIGTALFPGADSVGFSEDRILYERIDTLIGPDAFTFYRYSTDPAVAIYALSFTQLGPGQGNYRLAASDANGRVYEFVPPMEGILQGDYEPVVQLVSPTRQQLYTLGIDYTTETNHKFSAEIGLSNKDINTFSDRDDQDDQGIATFLAYENKQFIGASGDNVLTTSASYEFKQDRFNFVERYRAVEFNRDWNVTNTEQSAHEHIATVNTGLRIGRNAALNYQFQSFIRDSLYRGFQNILSGNYRRAGYDVKGKLTHLASDNQSVKTQFFRPKIEISKALSFGKGWRLGGVLENELRKVTAPGDIFIPTSFNFQEYTWFARSGDSMVNKYDLSMKLRYEQQTDSIEGFTAPIIRAQTWTVQGQQLKNPRQQLNWNFTYRNFWNTADTSSIKERQNIFLGRFDYRVNLFKGFIRANSLYELGSGKEQKREYTFVEAPNGNGSWAWQDLNDNGVQEQNEFYISQFPTENRFIRLFNSTTEFESVNFTRFNQILAFNFGSLMRGKDSKAAEWIGKFTTNTALVLERKVRENTGDRLLEPYNPFRFNLPDSNLVSENTSIRNTIYFNRTDPKFGAELTINYSKNKVLLVNGFDSRERRNQGIALRYSPLRALTANARYTTGTQSNNSEFFSDRRYQIISNEWELGFTHILKQKFRSQLTYSYAFKTNPEPGGGQFSVQNDLAVQFRYLILNKGTLTASYTFANIGYEDVGNVNQQLVFAMLQGLQDGNNHVFDIGFERKLGEAIQLSVFYEGRKTGQTSQLIHTGRAQLRAIF